MIIKKAKRVDHDGTYNKDLKPKKGKYSPLNPAHAI